MRFAFCARSAGPARRRFKRGSVPGAMLQADGGRRSQRGSERAPGAAPRERRRCSSRFRAEFRGSGLVHGAAGCEPPRDSRSPSLDGRAPPWLGDIGLFLAVSFLTPWQADAGRAKRKRHMSRSFVASVAVAAALVACGGGGDSGGSALQPPAANLTGTWHITETTGDNTCGDTVGAQDSYDVAMTQASNGTLSGVAPNGERFTGTISGSSMTFSASGVVNSSGGYINETSQCTIDASKMTFSCASTWSYVEAGSSCSGHSSATGACPDCSWVSGAGGSTGSGRANAGGRCSDLTPC